MFLERRVAAEAGATWVDLSAAICPRGRCDPVRGHLPLFSDTNHLSFESSRALAPRLASAIGG